MTSPPSLSGGTAIYSPNTNTNFTAWQAYCWLSLPSISTTPQNYSYPLDDGSSLNFTGVVVGSASSASVMSLPTGTWNSWHGTTGLSSASEIFIASSGSNGYGFAMTNIRITAPPGVTDASSFSLIGSDAEATGSQNGNTYCTNQGFSNTECMIYKTDGGGWTRVFDVWGGSYALPSSCTFPPANNYEVLGGIGTQTVTQYATNLSCDYEPWLSTSNPTAVTVTLGTASHEGIAFGVQYSLLQVQKNVVGRANAADQFQTFITVTSSGAVVASGTTIGTSTGIVSTTSTTMAMSYSSTISEAMAAGSVSNISAYSTSLTCLNSNTASVTALPSGLTNTTSVALKLQPGDAVNCTFTNTPNPTTTLAITKSNGVTTVTSGGSTSYTIVVSNNGANAANNAVVKDPVAPGLTCTTLSCISSGANAVTFATTSSGTANNNCSSANGLTAAQLQSPGIYLPSFPANSSATFTVGCAVTATGQ